MHWSPTTGASTPSPVGTRPLGGLRPSLGLDDVEHALAVLSGVPSITFPGRYWSCRDRPSPLSVSGASASDRYHGEHCHHQPLQGTRSGVGIDPEEHLDPVPRDQCKECKRGSYTPRRAFTEETEPADDRT